jgi:hypothetical protein
LESGKRVRAAPANWCGAAVALDRFCRFLAHMDVA